MVTRAPGSVRELVDQPLKKLGKLYENSLKAMMVCGLEFYLSASLVASLFQCPDKTIEAEQELQTLYTLSWVPLFLALILVYGPKLSVSIFPSSEHFERNVLRCKILTWIYAFGLLIWDPDMIIKTGPSLGVSIIFCITDVGRFIMDMKHLTDAEYDDNGNSLIIRDKTPRQSERQQEHRQYQQQLQEVLQEESYTVQMIGASGRPPLERSDRHKQQSAVYFEVSQQRHMDQSVAYEQRPLGPHNGTGHKLGSRRQAEQSQTRKRGQDMDQLTTSPTTPTPPMKSEYIAVLDSTTHNENVELIAKKSFTYEF